MSAEVKVRNASQAIEATLVYLRGQGVRSLPSAGTKYLEKILYATGITDYAVTSKLFTSDDWMIEVAQSIAPISSTVYQITVFNAGQSSWWKGSVKADGTFKEDVPLKTLSAEESRKLLEDLEKKMNVPPPTRMGGYGH
jgi:hypothetical protein